MWGFAHGFGLLLGPLFAAWMMDIATWRWVFWVALPLTALVIAVTIAATRGYTSVISKGKYDWIGLLLGATGITLLTYGLQNSSVSWTATATWGSIAAGIGTCPRSGLRYRIDGQSCTPLEGSVPHPPGYQEGRDLGR